MSFLEAILEWVYWRCINFYLRQTIPSIDNPPRKEVAYNLVSLWQDFFTNFQLWPLIELSAAMWKKDDHGVGDSPFIILNTSIRSAQFLLSSKVTVWGD